MERPEAMRAVIACCVGVGVLGLQVHLPTVPAVLALGATAIALLVEATRHRGETTRVFTLSGITRLPIDRMLRLYALLCAIFATARLY